jgi:hypothetical protein
VAEFKKHSDILKKRMKVIFIFLVVIHTPGIFAIDYVRAYYKPLFLENEPLIDWTEFCIRMIKCAMDVYVYHMIINALMSLQKVKKALSEDKLGFSRWIILDVFAILIILMAFTVLRMI